MLGPGEALQRRDVPAAFDGGFDHGDALLVECLRVAEWALHGIVALGDEAVLDQALDHGRAPAVVDHDGLRPARHIVEAQAARAPAPAAVLVAAQLIREEKPTLNDVLHRRLPILAGANKMHVS